VLPVWRLHRHVGMGGDKFVAAVAGEEVEDRIADDLRDRWEELFDDLIGEVAPLAGAPSRRSLKPPACRPVSSDGRAGRARAA
jgi:hypothetical protein